MDVESIAAFRKETGWSSDEEINWLIAEVERLTAHPSKGGRVPTLTVLTPLKSDDPTADMYRTIRDLAMDDETVPVGLRIAILEMVKTELVAGVQSQLGID